MNSWSDIQEEGFIKCLREIEKSYLHLPKHLRIRTEKWVEKLVNTGSNLTWRKQRNAYARLLLNHVMTKSFAEPFHTLPPDGPLPSFPAHVKAFGKDMLGPHESKFWRDLYHRVEDISKENPSYREGNSNHSDSVNMTAAISKESVVNKEIRQLNLLIRDQAQRITLLEQQLKDERVKHELEIQRIHLSYKVDLSRIRQSGEREKEMLVSQPAGPSASTATTINTSGYFTAPINPPLQPLPLPQPSQSPMTRDKLNDSRGRYWENSRLVDSFGGAVRPPPPPNLFPSFSKEERTSNIALANSFSDLLSGVDASRSVETKQPLQDFKPSLDFANYHSTVDLLPKPRISTDSLSMASQGNDPALAVSGKESISASTATVDEDFLHYIDQFQNELRQFKLEDPV